MSEPDAAEAPIEAHEEEVLFAMYDKVIIGGAYRPTPVIRDKVRWTQIAARHKVKKSFDKVMRRLGKKGLVSDHGKSGAVYSLTQLGVSYVVGKLAAGPRKE